MWINSSYKATSKTNKAKNKGANPIDVFFAQKVLGFEFLSDQGTYEILIDIESKNVKVQLPNGQIIDRSVEDYFMEDLIDNEEFELWLRSLIMSIEFFQSEVWKP